MPKIVFWHHCYIALRSSSKVGVNVIGQNWEKLQVKLGFCMWVSKISAWFFPNLELISVVQHQMAFSLCENPWSLRTVRIIIVRPTPRILTERERLFGVEQ